jgi:hypothetical protein
MAKTNIAIYTCVLCFNICVKSNENSELPMCACGCNQQTTGSRYRQGHDAKHKSNLIKAALGGSKRAANKLEQLGWTKFLEARRAAIASKEAKQNRTFQTATEPVANPEHPSESGALETPAVAPSESPESQPGSEQLP